MRQREYPRIAAREIHIGEVVTQACWLTRFEVELIEQLVEHHTRNKEIAFETGKTVNTVQRQFCTIMKKTRTHDRAELVIWAIKHGLVSVNGKGRTNHAGGS